jgi:hypothetical protein
MENAIGPSWKLTAKQAEVLKLTEDCEVTGICTRYVWTFSAGSRVVTREIRALEQKGLIKISYYRGGTAAVNTVASLAAT